MTITDVRPSGGFQDPKDWEDQSASLLSSREFPRAMYPGEFLFLLKKFKHPRWNACGITANRHGAKLREEHGMSPHGTIWFANTEELVAEYSIPCDIIPYATIRTAQWDEDKLRFHSGELVRGWRSALEILTAGGFLKPSDELTHWLGRNSFEICPREKW